MIVLSAFCEPGLEYLPSLVGVPNAKLFKVANLTLYLKLDERPPGIHIGYKDWPSASSSARCQEEDSGQGGQVTDKQDVKGTSAPKIGSKSSWPLPCTIQSGLLYQGPHLKCLHEPSTPGILVPFYNLATGNPQGLTLAVGLPEDLGQQDSIRSSIGIDFGGGCIQHGVGSSTGPEDYSRCMWQQFKAHQYQHQGGLHCFL